MGILIATGSLYLLSQEGDRKILLVPMLALGAIFFWLYRRHRRCCEERGFKTGSERVVEIIYYLLFSMSLGLAFLIYVFIPWWLPGYKGGIILP